MRKTFKLWASLVDKADNSLVEHDEELALLVRFKLHVYFANVQFTERNQESSARCMEKFADFLKDEGASYSQFPDLAPYFALPYILNNPNHSLLLEIRQVVSSVISQALRYKTIIYRSSGLKNWNSSGRHYSRKKYIIAMVSMKNESRSNRETTRDSKQNTLNSSKTINFCWVTTTAAFPFTIEKQVT